MKFLHFLISILLFSSVIVSGQPKDKTDDENYFTQINKLLVDAYKQRDTAKYSAAMREAISRYNSFKDDSKINYKSAIANFYYNFACLHSLLGNKEKALTNIDNAIKNGYINYTHILKDSDFNILHEDKDFLMLVSRIRSVGDYEYILKNAEKYNNNDKRELPHFTYQAYDNPKLISLRKTLNLDSLAGSGNDISKIISLMHWLHNTVPHDGNHSNPDERNALSMLNICKKEKRGLNCRGLAIVLNECYLAMGFKSRFVTCLPKDSLLIDPDCHVINMVYVPSLKKWIWIDPTFDAYVMNEKGELLGIEEVRQRIISGSTLIINPDANWNHMTSQTKDGYLLSYMTKNLYRLECPVSSEYNYETKEDGKLISYIQLLPVEYFKQKPDVVTDETKKTRFVTYNTNNASLFWATPEH
ncbi:MAG: transglutaminase-like domain-containing protein [Bacteroidota bacterium]|nr:transglutaminase-like domain-containing protein [Bacteroidota bacterium]